ncbi:MAG: hypothetical protein IJ246_05275 [Clostridia bacterium]|nr:hypothetical protein [Clostridia bacterium]
MPKPMTEKSETARLNRIYKNLPPNKKALAQGLIVQAARLRIRLNQLNEDIEENGLTEEFRQSEKQDPYIRTRPEADLFVKLDKNYQAIIRQLNDLVPEDVSGPSKLASLMNDE